MTAFLGRLVERSAVGAGAPLPLPAVPPLFAAGALVEPEPSFGQVETDKAASQTSAEPAVPLNGPPATTAVRRIELSGPPVSSSRAGERADGPDQPVRPAPVPPLRHAGRGAPSAHEAATPATVHHEASKPGARPARPTTAASIVDPELDGGRRHSRAVARAAPVMPAPVPARRGPVGQPESAPVVRISIGRIEVRAVTAPVATPPRPAPAPKRTGVVLEDYLRGGRER